MKYKMLVALSIMAISLGVFTTLGQKSQDIRKNAENEKKLEGQIATKIVNWPVKLECLLSTPSHTELSMGFFLDLTLNDNKPSWNFIDQYSGSNIIGPTGNTYSVKCKDNWCQNIDTNTLVYDWKKWSQKGYSGGGLYFLNKIRGTRGDFVLLRDKGLSYSLLYKNERIAKTIDIGSTVSYNQPAILGFELAEGKNGLNVITLLTEMDQNRKFVIWKCLNNDCSSIDESFVSAVGISAFVMTLDLNNNPILMYQDVDNNLKINYKGKISVVAKDSSPFTIINGGSVSWDRFRKDITLSSNGNGLIIFANTGKIDDYLTNIIKCDDLYCESKKTVYSYKNYGRGTGRGRDYITSIFVDKNDNIWFTSEKGVENNVALQLHGLDNHNNYLGELQFASDSFVNVMLGINSFDGDNCPVVYYQLARQRSNYYCTNEVTMYMSKLDKCNISTPTPTEIPKTWENVCRSVFLKYSLECSYCKTIGDYDCNGIVNGADYVVWRNEFVDKVGTINSDGNCDGKVTTSDYSRWRENYIK